MPEEEKREKLSKVIHQWNNNRLDLFEISQPDESLEFHGVMRFYFEGNSRGNVATKCLRVSSRFSTQDVVELLSDRFRPDTKMPSSCYSLFESHGSKERKLERDERPLVVQLNWNLDNRDGRFVFKKDKSNKEENCPEKGRSLMRNFKRTLSKKDKHLSVNTNGSRSTEKTPNGSCTSETKDERKPRESNTSLPCLPVAIGFSDNTEEAFLSSIINYTNSSTVHFKLSPAYVLYAAARSVFQRCPKHGSKDHKVTILTGKMVALTRKVIQRQQTVAGGLAFWMANSSELLHFLKHDTDLGPLTRQSQLDLSHLVHQAYSSLIHCLENELTKHLPTFLIDPERHGALPEGIELVLNTLMTAMSLLRRCRVNPSFTIQLFSQLFHFISAWLFNCLVGPDAGGAGLRSHYWGAALRQRLTPIEAWAERQGLELAADCHLGHIIQATTLLTMKKYSRQNAKDVQKTCFKLSSVQLQTLLGGYHYANNEPLVPSDLIDAVVTAARASADQLTRSEARDVPLEESLDLQLPFLLPDGGYSCDTVRGIPPGFREFLEPIFRKGLCSLTPQTNAKGEWTVHFRDTTPCTETTHLSAHKEPEVVTITLNKPLNSGMGVSIVAAKGAAQSNLGIYIKSIVRGGPAEMNGRLTAGDQMLSVDGQSLIGLCQERAAAIMMQTGPVVTLHVAKHAAGFHGLGALLSDPPSSRSTGHVEVKPCGSLALHRVPDPALDSLKISSKRQKEQKLQRNRQLYRSNPNMTNSTLEEEELYDPKVRGNNMAAVSTINLCSGSPHSSHRGYLTLPTPKAQGKDASRSCQQPTPNVSVKPQSSNRRTLMRQALSQDNLYVDSGGPLLDKHTSKLTTSHYSSFPIRQSVSTHNILSDDPKRNQDARRGSALWKTPFSKDQVPGSSVQPIRIDIPLTRAAHNNPPLTTFQSLSQQTAKTMSLNIHENAPQNVPKQVPQNQPDPIYACPISVMRKLPQPCLQSQLSSRRPKPQVNVTPTKHVSFQMPLTQQRPGPGQSHREAQEPRRDVWTREEKERLEGERRVKEVRVLEQEVQQLQVKVKRSTEENERLRKLSLEFQFQKRLQEIQERGNSDEEEDEDLDIMMSIQQLDDRAQSKRRSGGNVNSDDEEQKSCNSSWNYNQEKREEKHNGVSEDVNNMAANPNQENLKQTPAPENLPFKERQQLFSLAFSA